MRASVQDASARQDASTRDGDADLVLRVDGRAVTRAAYGDWLLAFRGEQLVATFAEAELVRNSARAAGIELEPGAAVAAVEEAFQRRIEGAFGGNRERWVAELAREGRTPAGLLRERAFELETDLLLERIARAQRTVTSDDVRAAWEERYGPEGVTTRVVALALPVRITPLPGEVPNERRSREQARREELSTEARALLARQRAGTALAELALERRPQEPAPRPEPFSRAGFPLELVQAVEGLPAGEAAGPFAVGNAIWLFESHGPFTVPLDDVAHELRAELEQAPVTRPAIEEVRTNLRAATPFSVLPGLTTPPDATDATDAVLRIGDEVVSPARYVAWLLATRGEIDARRYAERQHIKTLADEAGITIEAAEVSARAAADYKARKREVDAPSEDDWRDHLWRVNRTEASLLRELALAAETDLRVEELRRRRFPPTADDVRAAWERTYGPEGRNLEVRWILIAPQPEDDGEAATRERAQALRSKLEAGIDFASLAKLHSDDPNTKERGGRPSDDFVWTRIPDDAREVLVGLRPGQVSAPLQIGQAFYLFQVDRNEVTPLAGVRDELLARLREQRPTSVQLAEAKNRLCQDLELEVLLD